MWFIISVIAGAAFSAWLDRPAKSKFKGFSVPWDVEQARHWKN